MIKTIIDILCVIAVFVLGYIITGNNKIKDTAE